MDICGNVYVARDIKSFSLKCIYCDRYVQQWQEFMEHIQTSHNPLDESWIDPLLQGAKEEILVEEIKQETVQADHDTTVKDEFEFLDDTLNEEDGISVELNDETPSDKGDTIMQQDSAGDSDSNYSDSEQSSSDKDDVSDLITPSKFNPSFYRRKKGTTEFIELYKSFPCLWNPSDKNYKNFPLREEAHKNIKDAMKKKLQIVVSERCLKAAIKKIRKQYALILKLKDKPGPKLSVVVQEYFEQCSFFSVFEDNPDDITNESDSMKQLIFSKLNDVTLAFIETYGRFPALYNPKHDDYYNISIRKQAYQDMISSLKTDHDAVFTEDDINKCIYALRQWYYKAKTRVGKNKSANTLSDAQQTYVKKCSFLPPKLVKIKLPCEICGQVSTNESTLQVHMYKMHQIGELPHKCPECERCFEQRSAMIMHQQRNHVGKVHQCEYCERRFAVLIDLRRHIKTHTGERPFVCELCGKAFPSKTQLGYHMDAVHTKTRKFKCTMCPKDFLKRRDLKDHIKAHLNIRDKICETCGKGFTNCHSLIRHRQIHSEVKKFACKLCEAKFHQFVGLNAHMKRTHNIVKKSSN